MIKKDGFVFRESTRKNKKYDVFKDGEYVISFGDKRYQHYFDKLGLYRDMNHFDKKRRKSYYKRFGLYAVPYSAKYFSHKYLW